MYVPQSDWSTPEPGDPSPCFRQGDLVRLQWMYCPSGLPPQKKSHAGEVEEIGPVEFRTEVVALLSACCDLVNRTPQKRKGVLFTPLRAVPKNIAKSPSLLEGLRIASAEAAARGVPVPANLFYFEATSGSPESVIYLEAMAMVDFPTLVRATKVAELTEPARRDLRERIKHHFTRAEL